jgi:hypothetical protein
MEMGMLSLMRLLIFLFLITTASQAETIPDNAEPNPYGGGWKCSYGFRRSGSSCSRFIVPQNAEIDYTGAAWKCSYGYRRLGDQCERVVVPNNAEIDYTGAAWKCSHGYRRSGDSCERVKVPKNAEIDYTGASWKCVHGYRQFGDSCEQVVVPLNAELDYTGSAWKCSTGFSRSGDQCAKVIVPPNAQLDYTGSAWTCLKGYRRSGNYCTAMTIEEIAQEAQKEKELAEYIRQRRARFASSKNCEIEDKTGAQVCVSAVNAELDCDKYVGGETFSSCEAEVEYEITTDYKGRSSLSVDVKCEAGIKYLGGYSGSSSEYKRNSHSLYRDGSDPGRARVDFSFSSYQEITSVKISDVLCKIDSLSIN